MKKRKHPCHPKLDDITERVITLEVEFKLIKKLIYCILGGIIALLINTYWQVIIKSPTIVGNVIAILTNST